jgi:hypothetical protein
MREGILDFGGKMEVEKLAGGRLPLILGERWRLVVWKHWTKCEKV